MRRTWFAAGVVCAAILLASWPLLPDAISMGKQGAALPIWSKTRYFAVMGAMIAAASVLLPILALRKASRQPISKSPARQSLSEEADLKNRVAHAKFQATGLCLVQLAFFMAIHWNVLTANSSLFKQLLLNPISNALIFSGLVLSLLFLLLHALVFSFRNRET